jgi:hypothetical protein
VLISARIDSSRALPAQAHAGVPLAANGLRQAACRTKLRGDDGADGRVRGVKFPVKSTQMGLMLN